MSATDFRLRPVSEIMRRDVTTVPPGATVREVARILADQGISGAPVVATDGRVMGVVSTTDVIRFTADARDLQSVPLSFRTPSPNPWPDDGDDDLADSWFGDYFLPEAGPGVTPALGSDPDPGALDEVAVEEIMTPVPFTVEASTTVRQLASFLLRGRIHRAIVTEDERLVGIVTATDVLRVVAGEET